MCMDNVKIVKKNRMKLEMLILTADDIRMMNRCTTDLQSITPNRLNSVYLFFLLIVCNIKVKISIDYLHFVGTEKRSNHAFYKGISLKEKHKQLRSGLGNWDGNNYYKIRGFSDIQLVWFGFMAYQPS